MCVVSEVAVPHPAFSQLEKKTAKSNFEKMKKKVVNSIIHNVFPFNSVIWAEESGCGLTGDVRFSSITDFLVGSVSGVLDFSGKAS